MHLFFLDIHINVVNIIYFSNIRLFILGGNRMDNSKIIKKYIIYFIPVMLLHMIFSLIDKFIVINKNNLDLRLSIIHMSIYFYFFVIPIYLMIVNIAFNAKKEIEEYYKDTKLGALSIIGGNIVVLIINIVSIYIINLHELNLVVEFFIILVPELIMFFMIEFLGSFLVKKQDKDFEEETLEGVKIPERKVEFYTKKESEPIHKSSSSVILEINDKSKEENKLSDKVEQELTENKLNKDENNELKEKVLNVDEKEKRKEIVEYKGDISELYNKEDAEN